MHSTIPKYLACISTIPQHHAKHSPNLHKYTTHHLGIYLKLICIAPRSLDIYIVRSCTGTCSSIHLPPLIQPFCSQPLKLSIGSIAKDSYSPPPFSEINRYLIFFWLFLSYLHFISFSFCISLLFFLFLLCFMFQIFVLSFIPFR